MGTRRRLVAGGVGAAAVAKGAMLPATAGADGRSSRVLLEGDDDRAIEDDVDPRPDRRGGAGRARVPGTDPDVLDQDGDPVESDPYGLTALPNGGALVADAAGDDVIRVTPDGDATGWPRSTSR